MYRLILGLLFASFLASACTPIETPEPIVEYNFSYMYVSQGMTHQTIVGGKEISLHLAHDGGLDTSGVVVTIYDIRTSYLIETADPRGRFLPSFQLEPQLDMPSQEISILQIPIEEEPFIQVIGDEIPEDIKGDFLGTTSLENLRSFLSRWILGNSVNILFEVPPSHLGIGNVEVYRTRGTLSFILVEPETTLPKSLPVLPTLSEQEKNTVAISLQTHTFETIETSTLVERAQVLIDEILIAQAEEQLGISVTGSDNDVFPSSECGEGEELVTFEENGTSISECRPKTEAEIDPSSPTAVPEIDTDTFPAVAPLILGDCPESVHNRFAVVGPDRNIYRTWHPIIVELDPSIHESQLCSFAHEHGDPPHLEAPLPYFGFPAYHAGELHVIRQHEGYKVFTHIRGQRTGWDTQERSFVNPDMDMQIWVHQGSWSESRLTDRFHDVGFWSQDNAGNLTEVYYMADTGELFTNCPGQTHGGRSRLIASVCDVGNEIWDFGGAIGNVWWTPVQVVVTNPMNFMSGDPSIPQSIQLISTSEEICADSNSPCDYTLPFGHAESVWLGNMRKLKNANWQWSNVGGTEFLCTDYGGNRAEDWHCNEGEHGYLQQRVAAINFFGGISGAWDRTFEGIGDLLHLPFGAPGGN
jgi:hypothetical protein